MYNINKLLFLVDKFHKLSGIFEAPPVMTKFITDQVLNIYCSQVWLLSNEAINHAIKNKKQNKNIKYQDAKIHQNGLIINQCKNYTAKPASKILNKQIFRCPLNSISEWKYLEPLQKQYGIEYLIQTQKWPAEIKVNCIFNKSFKSEIKSITENWGGLWDPHLKEIFLDISPASIYENVSFKSDIDNFNESINHIKNKIRHEVQHLGQWVLKDIKSINNYPGTLGKKMRNNSVDIHGTPISKYIDTTKPERIEHSLRDIEFYTRLQDSVNDFKFELSNDPKLEVLDFAKFYMGMYDQPNVKYKNYKPDNFFISLKKNDSTKWKKAVKEFYKLIT